MPGHRITVELEFHESARMSHVQAVKPVLEALKGVACVKIQREVRKPPPERAPTGRVLDPPASTTQTADMRDYGFTGDICLQCGVATMKRNGSCLVCISCGTTTGCS